MHYELFVLILIGVLTLAAGTMQYRRGDRLLLIAVLTLPAGIVLGIYAGDHHQRLLALPAFALIVAYPLITRAARRRRTGTVGRSI